jgi:pimeloyl-ACP methyl ester carboxylesterase
MTPSSPVARGVAAGAITAGTALGVATLLVQRRDAARIAADPEHEALNRPLRGRPVSVESHDGTRLHAEVFGPEDAPTVVLVHGWMCALRLWHYQIQELSREFRVVAYDQRGHGRSGAAPAGDYSIEAFAEDLDAVFEACVPSGVRALLGGHSMGAMTMVAWAGRHPDEVKDRVRGAVLLNTGLGDLISESLVLRTPTRLGGARRAVARTLMCSEAPIPREPRPVVHRVVRYVALGPSASPARAAFCERMVLECTPAVRGACGGSLSELELHEAIEHLQVPAVVLAGARDRLTPPSHSRHFAATLPQLVDLVEVPDAGHMLPIEAPREVGDALRSLLD